jgi:hypothetical protein
MLQVIAYAGSLTGHEARAYYRAALPVAGIKSLDSAPAVSPWRLQDYNPSPVIHFAAEQPAGNQARGGRSSFGQPALLSTLNPSPAAAAPAPAASSDDDDDLCATPSLTVMRMCVRHVWR